jgi:S-adenosylmethionine decarboxylase proenzyme
MMQQKGRHLILDLYQCDSDVLDDYDQLLKILEEALVLSRATVLQIIGHKFEPQGATLLALLAESHASIHTWPCERYAAIDFYTCSERTDAEGIKRLLKEGLGAKKSVEREFDRAVDFVLD